MDTTSNDSLPVPSKAKRKRRTHSPAFRAKIVALAQQPDASIASIALAHNLNANLVHSWYKQAKDGVLAPAPPPEFLPVPIPAQPASMASVHLQFNDLAIDWPLAEIDRAIG